MSIKRISLVLLCIALAVPCQGAKLSQARQNKIAAKKRIKFLQANRLVLNEVYGFITETANGTINDYAEAARHKYGRATERFVLDAADYLRSGDLMENTHHGDSSKFPRRLNPAERGDEVKRRLILFWMSRGKKDFDSLAPAYILEARKEYEKENRGYRKLRAKSLQDAKKRQEKKK